jgi:tRNA modification GTPase
MQQLRGDLLQLLAELEAGLDFAEEDIEFASREEVLRRLGESCELLDQLAEQMATRHTSNGLPQVALIGPPNVGKSSLFNAIVARRGTRGGVNGPSAGAAALVSPERGTTRDYLTAKITLDGISCELVDTAGIDECQAIAGENAPRTSAADHGIEGAARALAAECGARATIRARCVVACESAMSPIVDLGSRPISRSSTNDIIVLTKSDLVRRPLQRESDAVDGVHVVPTSSRTGEGLDQLCNLLRDLLVNQSGADRGKTISATADRCRESIRLAAAALVAAGELVRTDGGSELVAVELRAALADLGKVVGAVYTDDLLDRIFSTFCIGK